MTVISTNDWLKEYQDTPVRSKKEKFFLQKKIFCEKLVPYFNGASAYEIHQHLLQSGLFEPDKNDKKIIDQVLQTNAWETVSQEFEELKEEWKGPDVPIFILPVNVKNHLIRNAFNGKTGLGFVDKIFLFVSDLSSKKELKALLTHEYNHVCRLYYLNKEEHEMDITDSIILEGIAEKAVEKRVGSAYKAVWTSQYSKEQAHQFWEKWILPNKNIKRFDELHVDLLFGNGRFPKWMGYCTGYHIVDSFCHNQRVSMNELIKLPTSKVIKLSSFSL